MRVLVVDDELTCRLVLKTVIERLGHECVMAHDGTMAWDLLQQSPVDVLITDWMMPGLDGPELCRRVRASFAHAYTYVILATALAEKENVVAGMEAGADDYLTKPVDPFDVQTRLVAASRVTALHRQILAFREELERLNGELAQLARTDALTDLGNRLRLSEDLAAVHAQAQRHGIGYCVAICDLDFFKSYNDAYGHLGGDAALRAVAGVLGTQCRAGERAYRYGGEEFVVLIPNEHPEGARAAMERLCRCVEALAIPHAAKSPPGVMTMSAGIAGLHPASHETETQVLQRADAALYAAKQAGRNQVTVLEGAIMP